MTDLEAQFLDGGADASAPPIEPTAPPDGADANAKPAASVGFMSRVKVAPKSGKFVTIFGDPGVGKTSVASACFPQPFFIPVEDGLLSIPDAPNLGVPASLDEVFAQIFDIGKAFRAGEFPFRSVVVDSITQFEVMAGAFVCQNAGVDNLEDVGKYARGRKLVAAQMLRLRNGCKYLTDLGLNVIAISHATTITEKPADMEDYTIWTLDIDEKSRSEWIANADAVIHVRIPTVTTEAGKRHLAQASSDPLLRTLGVVSGPSTIAKNRFRCIRDLDFTLNPDGTFTNPIADAFGGLN